MADSGDRVLETGQRGASLPARGSGQRCKLSKQGPGQSPGHKRILGHDKALKTHLTGINFVICFTAQICIHAGGGGRLPSTAPMATPLVCGWTIRTVMNGFRWNFLEGLRRFCWQFGFFRRFRMIFIPDSFQQEVGRSQTDTSLCISASYERILIQILQRDGGWPVDFTHACFGSRYGLRIPESWPGYRSRNFGMKYLENWAKRRPEE